MLHSHLRFIRCELLRERFSPKIATKWVHNPLLNYSVHAKVEKIAGLNSAIETNTTQNDANSTHNSLRVRNRRCEWTINVSNGQGTVFLSRNWQ